LDLVLHPGMVSKKTRIRLDRNKDFKREDKVLAFLQIFRFNGNSCYFVAGMTAWSLKKRIPPADAGGIRK